MTQCIKVATSCLDLMLLIIFQVISNRLALTKIITSNKLCRLKITINTNISLLNMIKHQTLVDKLLKEKNKFLVDKQSNHTLKRGTYRICQWDRLLLLIKVKILWRLTNTNKFFIRQDHFLMVKLMVKWIHFKLKMVWL
jgi:hypothetical protein